jgi:hypothetical protein
MGRIDPAATRGRTAPSRVGRRRRPVCNCGTGAASASLLPSHARGRPDTALTVVTASRWERARRGQPPRRLQGTTRRSPSRRETRNRFVERLQSSAPGRTTRSRVVQSGRLRLRSGDVRSSSTAGATSTRRALLHLQARDDSRPTVLVLLSAGGVEDVGCSCWSARRMLDERAVASQLGRWPDAVRLSTLAGRAPGRRTLLLCCSPLAPARVGQRQLLHQAERAIW